MTNEHPGTDEWLQEFTKLAGKLKGKELHPYAPHHDQWFGPDWPLDKLLLCSQQESIELRVGSVHQLARIEAIEAVIRVIQLSTDRSKRVKEASSDYLTPSLDPRAQRYFSSLKVDIIKLRQQRDLLMRAIPHIADATSGAKEAFFLHMYMVVALAYPELHKAPSYSHDLPSIWLDKRKEWRHDWLHHDAPAIVEKWEAFVDSFSSTSVPRETLQQRLLIYQLLSGDMPANRGLILLTCLWQEPDERRWLIPVLLEILQDYRYDAKALAPLFANASAADVGVLIRANYGLPDILTLLSRVDRGYYETFEALIRFMHEQPHQQGELLRAWSMQVKRNAYVLPQEEVILLLRQFLSASLQPKLLWRAFCTFLDKVQDQIDLDMVVDYIDMHMLEENRERFGSHKPWVKTIFDTQPSPMLRLLRRLDLRSLPLEQESFSSFDSFVANTISIDKLVSLFANPILQNIEQLEAIHVEHIDTLIEELCGSPHLGSLKRLYLQNNQLIDEHIELIAGATNLPSLTTLYLSGCPITDDHLQRLLSAPIGQRLEQLSLRDTKLTKNAQAVVEAHQAQGIVKMDFFP